MLRKSLFLIMIVLFMSGCTGYVNDSLQRMKTLPEHYTQFDAKLAWEVKSLDNSTVINGVIENIRYYEMSEVEVWVYALDANGKEKHRGVDMVYQIKQNEANSFTVKLPRLDSGTRLQFLYRYLGLNGDGGDGSVAVYWSQSFESKVP
jgi:hypothetical protein